MVSIAHLEVPAGCPPPGLVIPEVASSLPVMLAPGWLGRLFFASASGTAAGPNTYTPEVPMSSNITRSMTMCMRQAAGAPIISMCAEEDAD